MSRSSSFSLAADWSRATSARSLSRSASSLSRSSLASSVSPNQPNRSRNGLSARFAPSWTGATTSIAPVWTDLSGPSEDSPKYAVSRTRQQATSASRTARRRRTCLSYIPGSSELGARGGYRRPRRSGGADSLATGPAAVVRAVAVRAVDRLELLERAARAHRDASQRGLRAVRGHLRLVAQPLVEALEQRAAAGEHDPAVHDVRGQLGRRAVERLLDRVDDLDERLLERGAHLLGRQHDGLRQPGDEVAAADLSLHLLLERVRGADLELDLLGGLLADQELVLLLDVVDDRLVELVAADADRLRDDDPAERDHRDLRGAAADVDDHVARRLPDGKAGADRGRHRLLDQVCLARACRQARLLDGALLHPGHARGHADHYARVRPAVLVHLLDEVAQHLLGHVEVGDDAVLERADRRDGAGRAAEHPLRLDPDRVHLPRARVDRDDRRLGQHDAAPAHVDERVGSAEVDGHVAAAEARQVGEEAHAGRSVKQVQ